MKPKEYAWSLNGEIQPTGSHLAENRGLAYGDGLFETMIVQNGQINYWEDHLKRLLSGLNFLEINPQKNLLDTIPSQIQTLIKENEIGDHARAKLMIWRNTGGLYTPTEHSFSFLITVAPFDPELRPLGSLAICEELRLPKSSIGNFKTINSMYYVKAGLLKARAQADDLILLNTNQEVCECTSSNLFWKKNNTYYTPALETGCIAGVMRKNFLKELASKGNQVIEGVFTRSDLLGADCYYLTNVTGIRTCLDLKT